MNELELIKMRGKILTDLESLEEIATETRETIEKSAETIPNYLQDESGAAKGGVDLENALSLHQHCVAQRAILRNALRRMDLGEFGTCQDCGCEIELRRLEAIPGAICCIHCQEEKESVVTMKPRPSSMLQYFKRWWAA